MLLAGEWEVSIEALTEIRWKLCAQRSEKLTLLPTLETTCIEPCVPRSAGKLEGLGEETKRVRHLRRLFLGSQGNYWLTAGMTA